MRFNTFSYIYIQTSSATPHSDNRMAASHEAAILLLSQKAFKPNIKHIYYYALFTFVILLDYLTTRFILSSQRYKITQLIT